MNILNKAKENLTNKDLEIFNDQTGLYQHYIFKDVEYTRNVNEYIIVSKYTKYLELESDRSRFSFTNSNELDNSDLLNKINRINDSIKIEYITELERIQQILFILLYFKETLKGTNIKTNFYINNEIK